MSPKVSVRAQREDQCGIAGKQPQDQGEATQKLREGLPSGATGEDLCLALKADLLVTSVAKRLGAGRAATAEVDGIALRGQLLPLRIHNFDLAFDHERTVADGCDRRCHRRTFSRIRARAFVAEK